MRASNFNLIAPYYDWLCRRVFGTKLQQAQAFWLAELPPHQHILILGGGTGWILEQVLTSCSPQKIWYIEQSDKMLALAQLRLDKHDRVGLVYFIHGTENEIPADAQFDIILTPFVLDLFPDVQVSQMLKILSQHHRLGGLWVHTDFFRTNHRWGRLLVWSMYQFFRRISGVKVTQLPNYEQAFEQEGYTFRKQKSFLYGLVKSQVWQSIDKSLPHV